MNRAFRFWHAQVTRAYRLEALGGVRAMDRLHARESQAFVARFFVASFGRRVVECPQQPVRAIGGHGDGVGMVKSYAY